MIDQEMQRRKTYSGYIPPGRPKMWRDTILEELKADTDKKIRITAEGKDGSVGKSLTQLRFAIVDDLVKIKYLGKTNVIRV